jgi:hypothetical protein
MAWDVKRKAELVLVSLFSEALPDLTFYPSKGGTDEGGTSLPQPPFGAIWIENAEKTHPLDRIYMLNGTVVWVTRADAKKDSDVADHSETVRQIENAIIAIGSGADPERSLIVHGIEVVTVNEFTDNERHAHGDTISFVMGVSEFD